MFRIFSALLILGCVTLIACPNQCKPKMARCLNNCVQVCRPDKKWQQVVDCSKLDAKVPWDCTCTDAQTCRCKKPVLEP